VFRRRGRRQDAQDQELEVDFHLESDIESIATLVLSFLQRPDDESTRMALSSELEVLDDQTASADSYSNFKAAWVKLAMPGSSVIGATSDYSPGEDVPSPEFATQVALVKAAKNAVRNATTETLGALQKASDDLADVHRRAGEREPQ
jgi:hypothetical protein